MQGGLRYLGASLLEYWLVITGFVFHFRGFAKFGRQTFLVRVVRVPVGKRRNGGHAVRAPCAAFGRAALKSSDFDASIVLVVADQAVLGLCSEPRSSGGLVRSGEAKYRGTWLAGARAPGLRCGGCRSVFRGGRSSCHGPDRRTSRASGRKGHIVLGGDQHHRRFAEC